ncbi:hypothetical protein [uncultured Nitratireductor sp.]|uniref:hypothetical protein n=1 Tax=uncultured Nitratireductor sp. TaxID=520953 RepID=UPI002620C390|nr:hypothetical protein [uncultured Nitratireductor sp.]
MKRRSFLRFLGAAPLAGLATCAATPVVAQAYARTGLATSGMPIPEGRIYIDVPEQLAWLHRETEAQIEGAIKDASRRL